ncbi:hypothetical protein ACP70R_039466 [Stipagrostis hirtigluma subsp. patula]
MPHQGTPPPTSVQGRPPATELLWPGYGCYLRQGAAV